MTVRPESARQRGLTLLEGLVAAVVVTVGVLVACEALALSVRASASAEARDRAATLLEEVLERAAARAPWPGTDDGVAIAGGAGASSSASAAGAAGATSAAMGAARPAPLAFEAHASGTFGERAPRFDWEVLAQTTEVPDLVAVTAVVSWEEHGRRRSMTAVRYVVRWTEAGE